MSSALFVYLRHCNRLFNTNARFLGSSSALKSANRNSSSSYISRVDPSFYGRHRNSWLWSVHKHQQDSGQNGRNFTNPYYLMIIPVGIKRLFGYEDEEENDPEAILIRNIKRSILLIKKGEKEKAEQMLHIALKMAQDQQNQDGITYIYDIMANLAFDYNEYDKAEKLFVAVMRRCLMKGMEQNDNKFIHLNLKLAKVYQHSNKTEQSKLGYQFCLDALEKKVSSSKDEDTVMLLCLALDWYGRLLLEQKNGKEALSYLNRAHDSLVQFGGEDHPQNVLLLNDLGLAHSMLNAETTALEYFQKALKLGKEIDDPLVPSIMVNMGLLFLRQLNLENANDWCSQGLRAATKLEDHTSEKEARQCLSTIEKAKKK